MPSNATQDFKNHTKFDPPFHFVLMPILLINFFHAILYCWHHPSLTSGWFIVLSVAAVLAAFVMRTYSLKVQDRVIRLEERIRISALLPEAQRPILDTLTVKQFVALRFASDAEVATLAQRAASGNMTSKDIKAAIQTWRPDYFRV